MMTVERDSSIERAKRSQSDEIRMYVDRAASYLEQIKRTLDEAEASQEEEADDA